MNATVPRPLGVFSLATLLVSAHYGLGFLIGTAEQAMTLGPGGSLYALSVALGMVVLVLLVRFYWTQLEQIWTLLGHRYGRAIKLGVGLMAWFALIGVGGVQIMAAASILSVAGIPVLTSKLALALLFCALSLLPIEKASWIFRGLLGFNILALVYTLWALHGLADYGRSPIEFIPALQHTSSFTTIGIVLPTTLLVMIDMKCQQFIVQAKTIQTAYWGCGLAALLLVGLAFLPSAVITAAQHAHILPLGLSGKAAIPYILSWAGGGVDQWLGLLLIVALTVPALGLGSNVLRIQSKTLLDLEVVSASQRNWISGLNALLALAVALRGGEIIGLMLSFYAAYLSAAWLPFMAYLLDQWKVYSFSATSVRVAFSFGISASLAMLGMTLCQPQLVAASSPELVIMTTGLGFGSIGLLGTQVIEKSLLRLALQRETQP